MPMRLSNMGCVVGKNAVHVAPQEGAQPHKDGSTVATVATYFAASDAAAVKGKCDDRAVDGDPIMTDPNAVKSESNPSLAAADENGRLDAKEEAGDGGAPRDISNALCKYTISTIVIICGSSLCLCNTRMELSEWQSRKACLVGEFICIISISTPSSICI